jgi:hypothetical protein
MKIRLPFLLPAVMLLLAACADESSVKDATGFSNADRFDAQLRHEVLPGMKADVVARIWGTPQQKRAIDGGEEWIYNSGPAGGGYDVHTTVKFSKGLVTDIQNADLMESRFQPQPN